MHGAVDTRWEVFVVVALAVAARRAELLALNWADVDLANGKLSISKAMCQITGGAPFVKGTKSGACRSGRLSSIAIQALKKQRARQAKERLAAGAAHRRDSADPIFTNELGERLTPQAATKAFKMLARQACLDGIGSHSPAFHRDAPTCVGGRRCHNCGYSGPRECERYAQCLWSRSRRRSPRRDRPARGTLRAHSERRLNEAQVYRCVPSSLGRRKTLTRQRPNGAPDWN